jgi:hypothetical protein
MGLILPPSHQIHNEPPAYACTLCEKVFAKGQRREFEHHVIQGHPVEDLHPHSPRMQAPGIFDPDAGDAEWAKWIRDHQASDPNGWRRWMLTDAGKSGGGTGDG